MNRRSFFGIILFSLFNSFLYGKTLPKKNKIRSIIDIPSSKPKDFYSAELIKDTFYIPIKSKGYIQTFNKKTTALSKIPLPNGAEPDIVFYSKNFGLFIGSSDSFPLLLIRDISSKKVSIIEEELKINGLYRFSPTSVKESPSGDKLFIGSQNLKSYPIIYTKNGITPLINESLSKFGTYDAVWLSETELLVSSFSAGKVFFIQHINNNTKVLKEFKIKGSYRFSPILNQKIILTTIYNGKIYIFKVSKLNNLSQGHDIEILNSIEVPFKYYQLKRLIPPENFDKYANRFIFYILRNFNENILDWNYRESIMSNFYPYFNDVHWVTKNKFALTTRKGNAIILMNLKGQVLDTIFGDLIPTRFIGTRLPGAPLSFVSRSSSSQINFVEF